MQNETLCDKYPHLFGSQSSNSDVDSEEEYPGDKAASVVSRYATLGLS